MVTDIEQTSEKTPAQLDLGRVSVETVRQWLRLVNEVIAETGVGYVETRVQGQSIYIRALPSYRFEMNITTE